MHYVASTDTGGALDPKMYFRTSRSGQSYTATLYLNSATNTREINEFGWFETNSTGTSNGTKHVIFQGGGFPPGTLTPDPVGKVVAFTPTQYFGFSGRCARRKMLNGSPHGCLHVRVSRSMTKIVRQPVRAPMSPVRGTMCLRYFSRVARYTGSRAKIRVCVVKMAIATSPL